MNKAFTLAEVLITLGIIGIVAVLTMPALVANYQEKVTATKLKKFHSVMSQAYTQAIAENGTPDNWDLIGNNSPEGAENFLNTLEPYLKVLKNCGTTESGCAPDVRYKRLNGNNDINPVTDASIATMVLADGTSMYFIARSKDCTYVRGTSPELQNTCGNLQLDMNGDKPPNVYGRDLFYFYPTKNAIIPTGLPEETFYGLNTCFTQGIGCTSWVIYNENMDYLHCDDLTWSGKTKCD